MQKPEDMSQDEFDRRTKNQALISEYRFWKYIKFTKIREYICKFHTDAVEKRDQDSKVPTYKLRYSLPCNYCLMSKEICKEHMGYKKQITINITLIMEYLGRLMPTDLYKFELERHAQLTV